MSACEHFSDEWIRKLADDLADDAASLQRYAETFGPGIRVFSSDRVFEIICDHLGRAAFPVPE